MNSSAILSALMTLESELDDARRAKRQIEAEKTGEPTTYDFFEDSKAALTSVLNEIHDLLLVVLEAADLPQTRSCLIKKWRELQKKGGIGTNYYDDQFGYLRCPSFEYIATLIKGLRLASGDAMNLQESYELAKLETLLKKTPALLHRRKIEPDGEMKLQEIMHDYLDACFTEYKHPVIIPGIVKDFKPDGGIRNLRTAIEFKYANSREEVARSLGGIFEDAGGYSGSHDWTRFYSLIYQTEAFESEDRVHSEMTRAGLVTWKAILVTGGGTRGRRKSEIKSDQI
ncbi:MAG: hypothetical protein RKO24_02490 [Candidatus Competibacter sp.]|nr:hypothetical protein [Candidatus Competibacter sp.]